MIMKKRSNNPHKNAKSIREAVGLPDSNGEIVGAMTNSLYETSKNTIGYGPAPVNAAQRVLQTKDAVIYSSKPRHLASSFDNKRDAQQSKYISHTHLSKKARKRFNEDENFDYGASGGATDPYTEVNAENTQYSSEVPTVPDPPV